MASGYQLIAVMIALAIAAMLFTPINTTINDTSGSQEIENETIDAELDTAVELNGYNVEDGSETVRWYNETSDSYDTLESGTDYELHTDTGAIEITSQSPVSDGDSALVSYTYQSTGETQSLVLDMIPLLVAVLILGVAAFKASEMM